MPIGSAFKSYVINEGYEDQQTVENVADVTEGGSYTFFRGGGNVLILALKTDRIYEIKQVN